MKGSKLTQQEFIEKLETLHGKIYNYDQLNYINHSTPIILKCIKHNVIINNTPDNLVKKGSQNGCSECKREKSFNSFVDTAIKKFGNTYEYDYSSYINCYTELPLSIFCKKHNIHFQCSPQSHIRLSYGNCPECKKEQNYLKFIKNCENYHFKFIYPIFKDSNFINMYEDIKITCPEHGEFEQTPDYHLKSLESPTKYNNCIKCDLLQKQIEFIKKANLKHEGIYDYSKFIYNSSIEKGIIICKEHGEFEQSPTLHLSSNTPCPACGERLKYKQDKFINKCREIYGDLYDYSKVKYHDNIYTAVQIICQHHGPVWVMPKSFITNKKGCPKCNNGKSYSKHEIEWLNGLLVPVRLYNIEGFVVDGYNPDTKTIYEFLGDYWHGNPKVFNSNEINKTTKQTFGELYNLTMQKIETLKSKGYNVVYIWEDDWMKIYNSSKPS